MKRLIMISAVFLFINSCSEESTMFDPTYFGDGFKGITFTAEDSPDPLKADPTDWCSYSLGKLNSIEDDSGGVNEDPGNIPMGFSFGAAYPNPITVNGSTKIPFTLPTSTYVYIYVVTSNYEILTVLVNNVLQAGSYQVLFDSRIVGVAGVYRVIIETENFNCKGDIWIKGSEN